MNQKINFSLFKTIIKKFLGVPLTLISLFFIGKIIIDNQEIIIKQILGANFALLFSGILLISVFFFIKAVAWHIFLKTEGHEPNLLKSLYFYNLAEVKRYTPGNIFSFIARIVQFETLSVPKKTTLKLIFIETVAIIITSGVVSVVALPFSFSILLNYINATIVFLLFLLGIIGSGFIIYKLRRKLVSVSFSSYFSIFFTLLLSWIVFGIGNYLIAASFSALPLQQFLFLSSFFVLSWLIGYLSFVTPMGLGVREGVVVLGLSSLLPLSIASYLSILLRVGFIIGEVLLLVVLFIVIKSKSLTHKFQQLTIHAHLSILVLLITTFISYFSFFAFEKHLNFFTGRYDLGNMDQVVWNTINGRIFQFTSPDTNEIISRLAAHADFILILLSPFYLLWDDPRILLFIQIIVVGVGALFVYLVANEVVKNKNISLAFAISYLLNPFIQKQILFDFHSVTLATTFFLCAWYFLIKKRLGFTIAFLILAVLTKENMYLITGLIGLYIFFRVDKKIGLAITVVSFFIVYLLISYFIPHVRGGSEHFALSYYQDFGDSPTSIIKSIVLNPQTLFSKIISIDTIVYLKNLLIPTGFLALLSPVYLLFALPDLAINLLSENPNFRNITFHYASAIIPFVYISSVYGVNRLLKLKNKFINHHILFYCILFFAVLATYSYGVLPGSKKAALEVFTRQLSYREEIYTDLKKIPHDASVSATNNLGAHLTHRQYIYNIPYNIDKVDYVAFLLTDNLSQMRLDDQRELSEKLKLSGNYITIAEYEDFLILKRRD